MLYSDLSPGYMLSWNVWTPWSICTSSCGMGTQLRLRLCDHQHRTECTKLLMMQAGTSLAYSTQYRVCSPKPCVNWGVWGMWTECSSKCGSGTQSRDRKCITEPPEQVETQCIGNAYQHQMCTLTCQGTC